jgi:hypothetical protein
MTNITVVQLTEYPIFITGNFELFHQTNSFGSRLDLNESRECIGNDIMLPREIFNVEVVLLDEIFPPSNLRAQTFVDVSEIFMITL